MGIGVTTEEILLEKMIDRLDRLIELLTPEQKVSSVAAQPKSPAAAETRSGSGRRPAKKASH